MKFALISSVLASSLLFSTTVAAIPIQQTIVLKNSVARLKTSLKLDCTACTDLRKQSEHVYLVNYSNAGIDENHMYFTYQYGPDHDSCIYNADVRFFIISNDNIGFWCNGEQFALMSPDSTSEGCPRKVLVDINNNKDYSIELYMDW